MNIRVDLDSFARSMDDAARKLIERMERGVAQGAVNVERVAKQNLRRDPRGKHLMSSIHSEMETSGTTVTAHIGVGGATDIDGDAAENFGIYVHEGTGIYSRTGMGRKDVPWFYMDIEGNGHTTSGMQSNPFLENAYNSEGQNIAQLIARALMGGG